MPEQSHTGRYGGLLAVLVAFLVLGPPLSAAGHGAAATALGFPAVIALSAVAVGDTRRMGPLVLSLAALAMAGDIAIQVHHPMLLVVTVRGLFALVLGLVAAVIVARILQGDRVTAHSLLGSVCAYLLLGVLFASIYSALEILRPGSFANDGVPVGRLEGADPAVGRFPELFYFSFVSLTTLGYGDIVPAVPLARMLSVLEAVSGQLYLAILIAGLVGMHLAHRQRDAG